MFVDEDMSLATKRLLYRAVVLGVLLYGVETWPTKRENSRKLEVFHNRCLRSILGISTSPQRTEHISSVQVSQIFGMEESLEDFVSARRLCWLGHLAQMEEEPLPKKLLFGWLPQHRPGTWMHSAMKEVHMIDLVVMRTSQRACCNDVQVMRGANCWTHHKLVRAKLSFGLPKEKRSYCPFLCTNFLAQSARMNTGVIWRRCYKTSPTLWTWAWRRSGMSWRPALCPWLRTPLVEGGGSNQSGLKGMLRNSCPWSQLKMWHTINCWLTDLWLPRRSCVDSSWQWRKLWTGHPAGDGALWWWRSLGQGAGADTGHLEWRVGSGRLEECRHGPNTQKMDLQPCDNWCGISLLDVVGKLFARVIQERLQLIAEKVLAELQCEFRKERGCCDIIFVAWRLLEKAREHQDSLFALFVDLRKVYGSVPREAMWQVLERCSVPPRMLKVVKSFRVDEVASCRKHDTCAANRQLQDSHFDCECGRTFRWQGDLTRHKRFCKNIS